jgi:hypothetical protein
MLSGKTKHSPLKTFSLLEDDRSPPDSADAQISMLDLLALRLRARRGNAADNDEEEDEEERLLIIILRWDMELFLHPR